MTGLCIFMTLLNVLATPEKIIKIYAKKKLYNFNDTLIERKQKNYSLFPVYEIHKIFEFLPYKNHNILGSNKDILIK